MKLKPEYLRIIKNNDIALNTINDKSIQLINNLGSFNALEKYIIERKKQVKKYNRDVEFFVRLMDAFVWKDTNDEKLWVDIWMSI